MFGVLRPQSPVVSRAVVPPADRTPPPPRSLAAMPPSDFTSRETLLEDVKSFAAEQGYAVVIARSRANKLWLKCDRGGSYENRRQLAPDERKRKRGESRLLGCPFRMRAHTKRDGLWHIETENPTHNHPPSDDLSQHPSLRKMSPEQLVRVYEMCDAGNTPAETVEALRRLWPDIRVITREIYNARKKYKMDKDAGVKSRDLLRLQQTMSAQAAPTSQNASPAPTPAPIRPIPQQQDLRAFPDPNEFLPDQDKARVWEWMPEAGDRLANGNITSTKQPTQTRRHRQPQRLPPDMTTDPTALDPQLQLAHSSDMHSPSRYHPASSSTAAAAAAATAAAAAAAQDLAAAAAAAAASSASPSTAINGVGMTVDQQQQQQQQQQQFLAQLQNAVAQSTALSPHDHDLTSALQQTLADPDSLTPLSLPPSTHTSAHAGTSTRHSPRRQTAQQNTGQHSKYPNVAAQGNFAEREQFAQMLGAAVHGVGASSAPQN